MLPPGSVSLSYPRALINSRENSQRNTPNLEGYLPWNIYVKEMHLPVRRHKITFLDVNVMEHQRNTELTVWRVYRGGIIYFSVFWVSLWYRAYKLS